MISFGKKKLIFGNESNKKKKKSWRLTGSKPIRTLRQSGCCLGRELVVDGGVSALFDCPPPHRFHSAGISR